MKLLRLVTVLVVTAVTAATAFINEDAPVAADVEHPARGEFLARRDGSRKCSYGAFSTCANFYVLCKIKCKAPDSRECQAHCFNQICSSGPEACRHGGQCADKYNCDSKAVTRDGITEAAYTSSHDLDSTPDSDVSLDKEAQPRVSAVRNQVRTEHESSQVLQCQQCVDWMKQCKKTNCVRPWAPECQWECQSRLCKDGPVECRKGGPCASNAKCGKLAEGKSTASELSVDTLAQRSESTDVQGSVSTSTDEPFDCEGWVGGCPQFCNGLPAPVPDCEQECRSIICTAKPECSTKQVCTSNIARAEPFDCGAWVGGCAPFCNGLPVPNCEQECRSMICRAKPECSSKQVCTAKLARDSISTDEPFDCESWISGCPQFCTGLPGVPNCEQECRPIICTAKPECSTKQVCTSKLARDSVPTIEPFDCEGWIAGCPQICTALPGVPDCVDQCRPTICTVKPECSNRPVCDSALAQRAANLPTTCEGWINRCRGMCTGRRDRCEQACRSAICTYRAECGSSSACTGQALGWPSMAEAFALADRIGLNPSGDATPTTLLSVIPGEPTYA
ncbi:hypothetical protein BU23DRAFT_596954 [Bimuria novae-zelandiae CBS 107.79]|uniref:Uncharacterized protein n=1 Tax=Bimuria novae-zelandiae CBS 107.79 TaxID=1447943 RepID=A0A6A5VIS5_9PLEO|nr:hypothetical protein BU23DRAFT_596954 [Bimuria novae-zelandiae CBS 107.79]